MSFTAVGDARLMTGVVTPEAIVAALNKARFSLAREKETQAEIASELELNCISYQREVDLGNHNIIDFLVGAIGIEIKIGGSKRSIHSQCERYCRTGKLSALILVTSVAIGFPAQIAGVPCFIVSMGRSWL